MTDDTLRAALERKRDEYLRNAEQAEIDHNEFHAFDTGRVAESSRTAPMRWKARAEGIDAALSILAASAPDEGPLTMHPDDGHIHLWGCRLCGVDRPAAPALDVERERMRRIEAERALTRLVPLLPSTPRVHDDYNLIRAALQEQPE